MRIALALTACLLSAACARPIERGEALYQDGRYVEAAETFEVTEPRLAEMSTDNCAAFGLYRGLTFLRLGDVSSARKWLAYSYSIERKSPGMLLPEQRRALDAGWGELERRTAPPTTPEETTDQKIAAVAQPAESAPVAPTAAPTPKNAPLPAVQ